MINKAVNRRSLGCVNMAIIRRLLSSILALMSKIVGHIKK